MRRYFWITLLVAISSVLIFWTPFFMNTPSVWGIKLGEPSLKTIVANYDGMNFLVVARSWYQPETIARDYGALVGERGERYFAAHYPVYAGLIWIFDQFTQGDKAILLSILTSNLILASSLYAFFTTFIGNRKMALFAAVVAMFFPARMLSVRAVGSNEPIFIAAVLASLVAYKNKKRWLAAIYGAVAVLTRSPGILLFLAYIVTILTNREPFREKVRSALPLLLIPFSLIGLWSYFGFSYGDIFAYFKVGGNINLSFPPFSVFGSGHDWVSGSWLEDIVFTYGFYLGGILLLLEKYQDRKEFMVIKNFGIIYMLATWFIVHRDIARYSLPLLPIVVLGYLPRNYRRRWLWLAILIIPIYLAGWNFVNNNMAPIGDWTPFL